MQGCAIKFKVRGNLFLAGLLSLSLVPIANGQGSERQAWVALVKGMESRMTAEDTLRRTITFLNHYPRSSRKPIVEYMLGEIYFSRGKFNKALAYYKQLTTKLDHIAFGDSAMFRMGECYFNLGKIDKAEAMWGAMSRRYPKTHLRAEVETNECQILIKQGKMHQAAGQYRSLLSRYPHYRKRKSILVGLAQIDFAHQRYIAVLKRLARLNAPEAFYLKGRSLFALKRYQEAATYFDKIVKFHKKHSYAKNAAYLKAEAFFQAGNHKAATQAFTVFLQRYSRGGICFFARYKLAAVLLRQKRYSEALANINRLLADQQQPLAKIFVKYLRAEIYVGLKHFRQAAVLFREILTGSPPEQILETCLLKYAWVLYKNKQYPLAIKTAYRYIRDFSGNPRAVSANFIVANSHYFMRNYGEAIKAY
ncbi:tetratricopeptide repeat protein, partial [bacterium]|nr:tetratricopeptide repeat protein [bacterium]